MSITLGSAGRLSPKRVTRPSAFTLLEVMLALTLTAVVLVAISMAIDLHLRMLDARRGDVERIQLARALLQIIGNDLRSVIQQNTTDFSALASMATDAAAGGIPADLANLAGDTGSTGGTGGSDGGMGGTGGTGGSGGGGNALDAGSAGGSSSGAATDDADASTSSQDIAATSVPPPVPGLYGNQYELQIDVSRIPRVDEMQRMVTSSLTNTVQDIPSDVKTVAYYYYDPTTGMGSGDFRDRAGNPQSGLVRRVLDRAVTLHASANTNLRSLQQQGEVIAPEVAGIEFQYFDGTQWLYEWDSQENQGLPLAVRITLRLAEERASTPGAPLSGPPATADQRIVPEQIYSLVVRLPTALPAAESETDDSGMEAVGL